MGGIGLGFDTGGTYTDAVVMKLEDGEILGRSKSLTTRQDLSLGIRGAISGFDRGILSDVDAVFLSSTLATNSVVEGKGCRVGLIVMGSTVNVRTAASYSITIGGRHGATGKEEEPLDEDAARSFLESLRGKVDCIAVTGFMSVRNPEHEKRVKEMALDILGVPTVCGFELSSSLGFNERTVTCVMNARLIPVIEELLASVNRVMEEFGIDAPLMIVKGDGSVMSEEMAKERPVETILSGPASSLNGAMRLTGIEDAVVVDIGGTTTDIGLLRGGKPNLSAEGALIGGFRTRVNAAEITTAGIGGDSRVLVNGDKVTLSSLRVIPLCVASSKYPTLRERIWALSSNGPRKIRSVFYERNIVVDAEYFVKVKEVYDPAFTNDDVRFLSFIDGEPHSLAEAQKSLRVAPIDLSIERMEELGLIQRIGLTPTDVMHVRGTFTAFDSDASLAGISYHAANLGMTNEEFMELIESLIHEKIGREIVRKVLSEDLGEVEFEGYGNTLVDRVVKSEPGRDYSVGIRLDKPIIGVGAPSFCLLPEVARRLETELVLPENYDVGNAVGAISGKVVQTIEILIRTVHGSTLAAPACNAYSRMGRFYYQCYEEGVEESKRAGTEFVRSMAERAGARNVTVDIVEEVSDITIGLEQHATKVCDMRLVITATGEPAYRQRARRGPPAHGHEGSLGLDTIFSPTTPTMVTAMKATIPRLISSSPRAAETTMVRTTPMPIHTA